MLRRELKASFLGLGVLIGLFLVLAYFSGTSSAIEGQVTQTEHNLQGFLLEWYAWQADVRDTPEERQARWARCQRLMADALNSPTWAILLEARRLSPADLATLRSEWELHSDLEVRRDGRAFEMAIRRVLAAVQAFASVQREVDAMLRQWLWAGVTATLLAGAFLAFYQARQRGLSERLRELHRSSLAAVEEERKAVARDLHDTVAQDLAAAKILLSQANLEPALGGRIRANLASALTGVRSLAIGLRPPSLDRIGIAEALHELCDLAQRTTSLRILSETAPAHGVRLDETRALHVYRIVQESLQNALQHSSGTLVKVSASMEAATLRVEISDDGRGFTASDREEARLRHRMGLMGMNERALLAGATLSIDSQPGSGTRIVLEVPLERPHRR